MDNERNFFHQICKALIFGLSYHSARFQSVWIQDKNQVKKPCVWILNGYNGYSRSTQRALVICAIFPTLQQNCRNWIMAQLTISIIFFFIRPYGKLSVGSSSPFLSHPTGCKQMKTSLLSIPYIHYHQHMNKDIVEVVDCHFKLLSFRRLKLSSERRSGFICTECSGAEWYETKLQDVTDKRIL